MRIKPVAATVRIRRGDTLLAETTDALRVLETGRDVYDPVIYVPERDVTGMLEPVGDKATHCPLKGDCSYFALDGLEIAWTYDRPLDIADALYGHVAFYPDKVTIEEIGNNAPV